MAVPYQWQHSDSRGFASGVTEALVRARSRVWTGRVPGSAGTPVQDLRALLVGSYFLADWFSGRPTARIERSTILMGDVAVPPPSEYRADERAQVADTLLRGWSVLARDAQTDGAGKGAVQIATLDGGAPKVVMQDAGAFPILAAVAIVAGVAVYTAAVVYGAQKAAEIVDRELARREDTRRLLETQGRALELLATHKAQEEAIGHPLPLTDAERQVLKLLSETSIAIAQKKDGPLPSALPKSETVGQWGFGLIATVVIGVVLWLRSD